MPLQAPNVDLGPRWEPAPALESGAWPALASGELHVWAFPLHASVEATNHWKDLLSDPERARAQRLRGADLRRRYLVAHGLLRSVLARYANGPAEGLQFQYGRRGKPVLVSPDAAGWLRFNLSHSHELGILAIANARAVGIDTECLMRPLPALALARRFFTPREAAALARLPETQRPRAFLRAWTCKEAVVKAMGSAIIGSLERIEVDLSDPENPRWIESFHAQDLQALGLHSFPVGRDCLAALAATGRDWEPRFFAWPDGGWLGESAIHRSGPA